MRRYNPKEIEPRWQKVWQEAKLYEAGADKSKPKKYVLEYFPYPSGSAMHVGHVRNYTIGDVVSRTMRMQGFNVLHPMGWDAFGLPAENFAIKTGTSPQKAVAANVAHFKKQLMQMGFSYDWSREINSTDPDFYKWTQWFFLLLFKKGLAYQKEALVNWDPEEKTVLANEQVIDGRGERSGALVEKKSLNQWFFKITDYAERLEKDLDTVDWSPAIKAMQKNWIGKSTGAEIGFTVAQDNKKSCLVAHGISGHKKENWFPWLKKTLGEAGWDVNVPSLPTPDYPTIEEWNKTLSTEFEDGTVLVGHSLGAPAVLNLLQSSNKKAGSLILVAPVNPMLNWKHLKVKYPQTDWDAVKKFGDINFDWEKINRLAGRITIYYSDNDKYIPFDSIDFYKQHLPNANFKFMAGKGHFNQSSGITELPEIIECFEPKIKVFTTRPDTIFGATFLVLAPENLLVRQVTSAEQKEAVTKYIVEAERKSEVDRMDEGHEKTGVFTGAHAINPANDEKIPIWVADYVLPGYGTGAIMGVPAHDERDGQFARKFELPITSVLKSPKEFKGEFYEGEGELSSSGEYDGTDSAAAREKIIADLAKKGLATEKVHYKLRDWLISRQRYWGAPIPIIHCPKCGAVPVPDEDLPVILPEVKSYEPSGDGRSPLANVPEFVSVKCPKCGGDAQRETDTMDGFACSSWYFLRFADPHNNKEAFDKAKVKFWLPVDDYIGGAEHAVMHLLYARFWTKVMADDGLIDFDEPFQSLRNHGMILAPDGQKMSKSKGNTIEPDGLIEQGYGADSIRLMELFIGPWNQAASWSVEGLAGVHRFLSRVWTLVLEFGEAQGSGGQPLQAERLAAANHRAVKKVSNDIKDFNFNTAIAAQMSLVNELYKIKADEGFADKDAWHTSLSTLLQLLAPFAPHVAEELWSELGHESSVHISPWPTWDEKFIKKEVMTLAVQVNGKLRGETVVPVDISEANAIAAAKEAIAEKLAGQKIKKEIYVPGRIVNLVI